MKESRKDILGQDIIVGCHVAAPSGNLLKICKVVKISPKMLHVECVQKVGYNDSYMIYPERTVRLDGPDVLAYILRG